MFIGIAECRSDFIGTMNAKEFDILHVHDSLVLEECSKK